MLLLSCCWRPSSTTHAALSPLKVFLQISPCRMCVAAWLPLTKPQHRTLHEPKQNSEYWSRMQSYKYSSLSQGRTRWLAVPPRRHIQNARTEPPVHVPLLLPPLNNPNTQNTLTYPLRLVLINHGTHNFTLFALYGRYHTPHIGSIPYDMPPTPQTN